MALLFFLPMALPMWKSMNRSSQGLEYHYMDLHGCGSNLYSCSSILLISSNRVDILLNVVVETVRAFASGDSGR